MAYTCQICGSRPANYVKPHQKHRKRRGRRLGGDADHDACQQCWNSMMESRNVQRREERFEMDRLATA